ncbi:MAG: bacteriochlorophyll 4-vinyl reductase [Pseudomonadota bacterium]
MHATTLAGRIGPNAITRVAEVLPARLGSSATWELFERAGLVRYLRQPPERMVGEDEVRALHATLREQLGGTLAGEVARAAGTATADYLLAHRIPHPLQRLLRALPARLAARVLLRAVARNAWTFVGSGRLQTCAAAALLGRPVVLRIRGNPLARGVVAAAPACDYCAAAFERLFQVLVHPRCRVVEAECEACGAAACRFEIRW